LVGEGYWDLKKTNGVRSMTKTWIFTQRREDAKEFSKIFAPSRLCVNAFEEVAG
jgi:hypothetical protein